MSLQPTCTGRECNGQVDMTSFQVAKEIGMIEILPFITKTHKLFIVIVSPTKVALTVILSKDYIFLQISWKNQKICWDKYGPPYQIKKALKWLWSAALMEVKSEVTDLDNDGWYVVVKPVNWLVIDFQHSFSERFQNDSVTRKVNFL